MYYKDMDVWKKSIKLVTEIYLLTAKFPKEEMYGIVSQMRRSAVSIPSNIAEGAARYSNKDTIKFIDIAIGSLAELDTQIIIAKEIGYINDYEIVEQLISNVFALLRGFKNSIPITS